MRKTFNKKRISLILSLLLIISFNTSFVYANSQSIIEKLSNPHSKEGDADGILPKEGDRSNSYAWTSAQLGDYIYIGSNRNLLTQPVIEMALGDKNLDLDLVLKIMNDLSEGDIPTGVVEEEANNVDLNDNRGRIFRYGLKDKEFKQIHISEKDTGYRAGVTFTPKGES